MNIDGPCKLYGRRFAPRIPTLEESYHSPSAQAPALAAHETANARIIWMLGSPSVSFIVAAAHHQETAGASYCKALA
jgi:hypothetical protein